jgi:hypothetical protein
MEKPSDVAYVRQGRVSKGNVIGISEMVEIVSDAREAVGGRVPTFEDKDRAEPIVREVVHVA